MSRLGRIDTISHPTSAREGCWLVRLVQAGRGVSMGGDRFALFSADAAGDDFRSLRITLARPVGHHNEDELYIFDPDQMPATGDWVWVEDR